MESKRQEKLSRWVVYSKKCSLIYVLSRNTVTSTTLEAEMKAYKMVCEAMGQLNSNHNYALCVDSKNVVEMHEKARAGVMDNRKEFDSIKDIFTTYPNVYVIYVNRMWNNDADFLSKQGLQSNFNISKWFQP